MANTVTFVDQKRCNQCHRDMPLTMFRIAPLCKAGRRGICRQCDGSREQARARQKLNRPRIDNTGIQGRCRNMLYNAKARAIKKNLEFDITKEFLESVAPLVCPVFGMPLDYHTSSGIQGRAENGPSLDRIDNSKGYTKDNVRIISWKANRLKSNATADDLFAVYQYMQKEKSLE